ncbi:MAG: hypothetical protein R3249_11540 [Nitriliruptorales bacterium]|nr:hypothetical protein [Nitriliruptorales bacterium]
MSSAHNPTDLSDADLVAHLVDLHGDDGPPAEQWAALLADPYDGPIQVVYLVNFRERALTPDAEGNQRTGMAAFFAAGLAIRPIIEEVGGEPKLGGFVTGDPTGEGWDYIGAARYPSPRALLDLWLDDRYIAAGADRHAGTAGHRVFFTRPVEQLP